MEIKEKSIQIRLVFFIQLMLSDTAALAGDIQSVNNQGKAFAQSMNQSSVNQAAAQMKLPAPWQSRMSGLILISRNSLLLV